MCVIRNIALLIGIALITVLSGSAQRVELSDLSANKLLNFARNAERLGDVYSTMNFYEAYLAKKPNDHKVMWRLAETCEEANHFIRAFELYAEINQRAPDRYDLLEYNMGRSLMRLEQYRDAKNFFGSFLKSYKGKDGYKEYRKIVKQLMFGCDSAEMLMLQPLIVQMEKEGFNNPHADHSPILTDEGLVYSAQKMFELTYYHLDSLKPKKRFYLADGDNSSEWMPNLFDADKNYSSIVLTPDEQRMYYAECKSDWRNRNICKICVREKKNGQWMEEEILPAHINLKGYSATMPAVGIDPETGKEVIYFVSDRPEGKGGQDIWYTVYDPKKHTYKEAKNAGTKINTPADEMSPYFNNVERKLYFSSNGLSGLGGFDIFWNRGQMRKWSGKPINLGYPVNSGLDELFYTLEPDRNRGYFVSNRSKDGQLLHPHCCDDIFSFYYPEKVDLLVGGFVMEIDDSLYFSGAGENLDFNTTVNSRGLAGAEVKLYLVEKDSSEVLMKNTMTNEIGVYEFNLEPNKDYRVKVEKDGYFRNHIDINTTGQSVSDTIYHNFGMSRVTDREIAIDDIYFEFGSSDLTIESKDHILRSILPVLKENPSFNVLISAHTDNVGSESANISLSQQRAESVVRHLQKNGIMPSRLQAKGYGESRPVAPNTHEDGSDNPEGRQKNRRVEMKLKDTSGQSSGALR